MFFCFFTHSLAYLYNESWTPQLWDWFSWYLHCSFRCGVRVFLNLHFLLAPFFFFRSKHFAGAAVAREGVLLIVTLTFFFSKLCKGFGNVVFPFSSLFTAHCVTLSSSREMGKDEKEEQFRLLNCDDHALSGFGHFRQFQSVFISWLAYFCVSRYSARLLIRWLRFSKSISCPLAIHSVWVYPARLKLHCGNTRRVQHAVRLHIVSRSMNLHTGNLWWHGRPTQPPI